MPPAGGEPCTIGPSAIRLPHGAPGIERAVRILKHHLDALARLVAARGARAVRSRYRRRGSRRRPPRRDGRCSARPSTCPSPIRRRCRASRRGESRSPRPWPRERHAREPRKEQPPERYVFSQALRRAARRAPARMPSAGTPARDRAPPRAAYGCTARAGRRGSSRPAPCSTSLPCCITAMRSAISATTPKSWVMNSTAMCRVLCISRISARICAWVVTSSAVVGSSAIRMSGSSISAMAIIARCRWPPEIWCGIGVVHARRFGQVHGSEHVEHTPAPRLACRRLMDLDHLLDLPADREHRVQRRHRLLEDHRDAAAAQRAHALGRRLEQVLAAVEDAACARSARGATWNRPRIERAITDLPDPDSPTTHRISSCWSSSVTSSTACGRSAHGGRSTVSRSIARTVPSSAHAVRSRGLRASLRPSPTRLMAMTVSRIAMPGIVQTHHAERRARAALADDEAPAHHVRIRQTEKRQARFDQDRGRHHQRSGDDDRRQRVRQDVAQDDACVAHAHRDAGEHEFAAAHGEKLAAHQTRHRRPGHHGDGDDDVGDRRREHRHQQDREQEERNGLEDLREAHQPARRSRPP